MVYVMSDIHGCYDEFNKMLALINFSDDDELYIIGDIVDRGPKPITLLQHIMNRKNIHLLKGNHEEMMFQCLIPPSYSPEEREDLKYDPTFSSNRMLWIGSNGGDTTAKEYNMLTYKEQREIYRFLKDLELFTIVEVNDKKYLIIHGSPTAEFIKMKTKGNINTDILWDRIKAEDIDSDLVPGYEVIVGHTPTIEYGKEYAGKIIEINHKYLIDCGCVFGESLGCICLDNGVQYYVKSEQPSEI